MIFYLTDVRVQNRDVEILGYEQGKQERKKLVHPMGGRGFCPEIVVRVDRMYTQLELQTLQMAMAAQVSHIQCTMKYKLRYFQCEDNGERKKYPFIVFYVVSLEAWNSLSRGREAVIIDRCNQHDIRVIGKRDDGEREYGDGRLCNVEQGKGLSVLTHQFMRWARLEACTWHNIEIGADCCPLLPIEKEVHQTQQMMKPDMAVAAFDIETANTLKIYLDPAKKSISINKIDKNGYNLETKTHAEYYVRITPRFEKVSANILRSWKYKPYFSVSYTTAMKQHTLRVKKGDGFVIKCIGKITLLKSNVDLHAHCDETSFQFVFYFRDESGIGETSRNRINMKTLKSLQSVWKSNISAGKCGLVIKAFHSRQSKDDAITDLSQIADKVTDNWTIHLSDISKHGTTTHTDLLKFNGFSDPSHVLDEIVCISWVERLYSTQEKTVSTILMIANEKDRQYLEPDDQSKVKVFSSEYRMLEFFFTNVIGLTQSGIIMGYNTHGFDTPYIFARLQRCFAEKRIVQLYSNYWKNTNLPTKNISFGHSNETDDSLILPIVKSTESSQRGQTLFCTFQAPAVFDVDLCVWLRRKENHPKKDGEQISLKLDNVAEYFLKDNKHDIDFKDINRYWYHEDESASRLRIRAALYCEQDSDLVIRLANCSQINMIEFNLTLSRIMGVLPRLMPMNNVGEMERLRPFLYEASFKRGTIIDQPSVCDMSKMNIKLKGGIVFDAEAGEHGKFCDEIGEFMPEYGLGLLDYKSLYPSTMIAHNLSYDTSVELGDPGSFVASFKRSWQRGKVCKKFKIIVDRRLVDSSDKLGHDDIIVGVLEVSVSGAWIITTNVGDATVEINDVLPNRSCFFSDMQKFGVPFDNPGDCGKILSQRDEFEDISDTRRLELMETNCKNGSLPASALPYTACIISCLESILDRYVPKSVTRVSDDTSFALYCAYPEFTDIHICESGNQLKSAFIQVNRGSQRGIVPEMLQVMLDARSKKKQEKKLLPPELQATIGRRLDLEQLAIKVQTNSIYGASYLMEGMKCFPAATTSESRIGLLRAKTYAEAHQQEVVYGDTDSIFSKMTTSLRRETVLEALSEFPMDWFTCDLNSNVDCIDNWEAFCCRDMTIVDEKIDQQLESCDFGEALSLLQKKLQEEGLSDHITARLENEEDFEDLKQKTANIIACYRCFKVVRDTVFAFWKLQGHSQTLECRWPNELEHENMVLKMEFFKETKKCYVGMVAENPKDTPHMYFKGLSMVKGDCIHISRRVQALVYDAKYQPHKLRKMCSVVDTDEANSISVWELCRKEIIHLFAPLLKGNVDNEEFYSFCERMLTMNKTMKAEKSYDNPLSIAQVVARRSMVEIDPSLACAIGEKQGIIYLRSGSYIELIDGVARQKKIAKRNEGAIDPRVLRLKGYGDRVDFTYYIDSCFKGLKGGERLSPGNMNRTTFVQLKPVFQFLYAMAADSETYFMKQNAQICYAKSNIRTAAGVKRTRMYEDYVNKRTFADCENAFNPQTKARDRKRKQHSLLDMLSKKTHLKKNDVQ